MNTDHDSLKAFLTARFPMPDDLTNMDTYDLIRNGVLDSFSIFDILLFIEEQFKCEIQVEQIHKEDFRTLERIVAFVQTLQETKEEYM